MCKPKQKPVKLPEFTAENLSRTFPQYYYQKVVPVERRHNFDGFYTPSLTKSEFGSTPIVLFLGQYSVGKTSMINYLTGADYPGSQIGPEPTTDCFTMVYYSETPHEVMGASLVADPNMPFQSLEQFGSAFHSRLRGAGVNSQLLKHMTLIDTPGILSGDKQGRCHNYEFTKIVRFLAEKVDMIVCAFDTTKLDISDEFKEILKCLIGNDEKIKIVLNKADCVSAGELVRVRGALMWALSKIIDAPEVPKVYIVSFNERVKDTSILSTFKDDYLDLFNEFEQLPSRLLPRKINDVIKRAKRVRVHALVMEQILKKHSDEALTKHLTEERLRAAVASVERDCNLTSHDMPNLVEFKEKALKTKASDWHRLNKEMFSRLEEFIRVDVPKALSVMPRAGAPDESLRKCVDKLRLRVDVDVGGDAKKSTKRSTKTSANTTGKLSMESSSEEVTAISSSAKKAGRSSESNKFSAMKGRSGSNETASGPTDTLKKVEVDSSTD